MKDLELMIIDKASEAFNGDADPLKVFAELQKLEKKIKFLKDEILETAINEFEKYGEKSITQEGFNISLSQSARYSYSHIPSWKDLTKQLKKIEAYAKTAQSQGESIILETGEIIEPAVKSYSKESLKFKQL